jgi:hypothetical protein
MAITQIVANHHQNHGQLNEVFCNLTGLHVLCWLHGAYWH